jgi:hypothetical protein
LVRGSIALGPAAAVRRTERVDRDHKVTVGVDRLARPDQRIEPSGHALGDAAALLAGRVLAGGMMARGIAVDDQHRVVGLCIRSAVSLVSELEDGQCLSILQPEIPRGEGLAFDLGQCSHGYSSFFGQVAIRHPTGYLQLRIWQGEKVRWHARLWNMTW